MAKKRPKHLDLLKIKLPLPGIVSILHRISGAGLFLMLPFLLYLLESSLSNPERFEGFRALVSNPLAKLVLTGLLWAYVHHVLAGIRYLLLDLHYGVELAQARASSKAVMVASLGLTLILGVALW